MTLQQFRTLTAEMDDRDLRLRRAMTVALAAEIPRTPEGYERFYARVVDELDWNRGTETEQVAREPELAAV